MIPFGLSNIPASFQGYINKIFVEKLNIFVIVYLDDIFIYTDDDGDGYVTAVRWVLEQLRKFSLYANLKKCQFHQDEVRFLGYVVSSKGIRMEDKQIEAVKQWPEPQSVRDIQVFLGFANFYRRFIQGFSRIAAPLTSMLKTSSTESAEPKKGVVGVGGGSRAGRDRDGLDGSRMDDVEVDGGEVEVGKKGQNLSKFKKTESGFLISEVRMAFTELRLTFIKALILHHFDTEHYIRVETDVSGYAIGRILSQLTSDDLGQWYPVAFFSRKKILAETRYKTHDSELLAIVKAFKTWKHYLKESQQEVLILTNHNNLRWFIETKSLSSRQVCWAQELFCYHFRIEYHYGKANGPVDALSWYLQQNAEEEETLRTKNIKILHRLQSLLARVLGLLANSSQLSLLYQVLICGTTVRPQLHQFWDSLRDEIARDSLYFTNIGGMRLQLLKLQNKDEEAKLFRGSAGLPEGWEDVKGVLRYQRLPYVPAIIRSEVISHHYNDPLIGHFGIDKTKELGSRKYYWPSLKKDVKSYIRGCDVCLASKTIRHKPYGNL